MVAAVNSHRGNRKFRTLIRSRRAKYQRERDKLVKAKIVLDTLNDVVRYGFVFQVKTTSGWNTLDWDRESTGVVVLKKIRQGLREKQKPSRLPPSGTPIRQDRIRSADYLTGNLGGK
jgi:hypothetical protein